MANFITNETQTILAHSATSTQPASSIGSEARENQSCFEYEMDLIDRSEMAAPFGQAPAELT